MNLMYWGTWDNRDVFIHIDCKVSHSKYVQSLGMDKDTILIGCNAYVDTTNHQCLFCKKKFKGKFPELDTKIIRSTI